MFLISKVFFPVMSSGALHLDIHASFNIHKQMNHLINNKLRILNILSSLDKSAAIFIFAQWYIFNYICLTFILKGIPDILINRALSFPKQLSHAPLTSICNHIHVKTFLNGTYGIWCQLKIVGELNISWWNYYITEKFWLGDSVKCVQRPIDQS